MVRANETIQHICSELYTVQDHLKLSYSKIKLELLLILTEMNFDAGKKDYVYFQKHKRLRLKIHDFVVEHIIEHYTIEELAERFEISPTSLKKCFKKMYSVPIYTYCRTIGCKLRRKC